MAATPAIPPEFLELEPTPAVNIRRYETTSATVTLTPKSGRKYVLDEILADGPHYADIIVGTNTIMRVPLAKNDCKFTPKPGELGPSAGILNFLRKHVLNKFVAGTSTYPITIKFDSAPTLAEIYYYDIPEGESLGDEFEVAPTEYVYCGILTHSAAVSSSAKYAFDTIYVPTGFPELKSGTYLPSNTEFELKVLAFAAVASGSTEFTYLHLWLHGRELFHPEDHKGLSVKTSYNDLKFDVTKAIAFVMPKGAVYKPGYQIVVEADATYDGTNTLAAESAYCYLIGIMRRLGGGR